MVQWVGDLFERSAVLAALPDASGIVAAANSFPAQADARASSLSDYASLLAGLLPAFGRIAASLGASATLDPLIGVVGAASGARALQKAHRTLLLALEDVV